MQDYNCNSSQMLSYRRKPRGPEKVPMVNDFRKKTDSLRKVIADERDKLVQRVGSSKERLLLATCTQLRRSRMAVVLKPQT